MEEENEPFYEVRVLVKGQYKTILDGLDSHKSHILASNLFDLGFQVDVTRYWIE